MKESIYIETSVVSYYTSKPSRDLIALAHQQITRDWWPVATDKFSVHISQVVLEEAKMGDAILAKMRLESVKKFKVLKLTEEVEKLASVYIKKLSIPPKALRDSAHLAVASCNKIDYLVTWNCKHLANAEIIKKLIAINNQLGMHTPIICTPEELMEA